MDFNVPKKFSIGSVDYNVKQLDYVNHGEGLAYEDVLEI